MKFPLVNMLFPSHTHVEQVQTATHDVDVWIPAAQASAALAALSQSFPSLPKYQSKRSVHASRDLRDAMNRLGQHAYLEYGDRSVCVLFISERYDHDQAVYAVLAPYIPEECSITVSQNEQVLAQFHFANHHFMATGTKITPRVLHEGTLLTGHPSLHPLPVRTSELGA